MTQNKKFFLVLFFLVIVPIIFTLYIEQLEEIINIKLEVPMLNQLSYFALLISALSSAYILYGNHSHKNSSFLWYIIGTIFLIFSIFFLYTIYSLSHFGF